MPPIRYACLLLGLMVLHACTLSDSLSQGTVQAQSPSAIRPTVIEWAAVPALLRSGRVEAIVQLHDLTVTLTTITGEEFIAREPALDAILDAIREHAPNAESIVLATE